VKRTVLENEAGHDIEPPPVGRTWKRLYAAVLINLAALSLIFYAFTRYFE
jgi:hypothetical protein